VYLRRVFSLFLCASSILACRYAHAQTSLYASADITQYDYSSQVAGNVNDLPGSGSTNKTTGAGVSGGVVQFFANRSRLKAAIDVRGMYSPGVRGGAGGFGALRIAFVPHRNPCSPYFELGGGVLTTTYPKLQSNYTVEQQRLTGGASVFNAGLILRPRSRIAIRAIEIGGFAGSKIGLASVGFGVIYTPHAAAAWSR
jgi:hypothetical protein